MKISLRKQIVISFSVAFMIIIALFGGGLYSYNSYHYPRQSYEYCRKIVTANITLIDNYFAQIKNISGIVAGDADINQAVSFQMCIRDRVRIAPEMAYRVYDEFSSAQRRRMEDGSFLVSFEMVENEWMYGYFMAYGPYLEVLKPADVREEFCLRTVSYTHLDVYKRQLLSRIQ